MEKFEPEYYLVEDGKIRQVEESDYKSAAGPCGPQVTGFALKGIKGFVAESLEEKERLMLFHQEWLTQSIEVTRARIHASENQSKNPTKADALTISQNSVQ